MKWVLPWLFCLLTGPVFALSDISGAADYPALKRFPFSSIVQYDHGEAVDYRLILGGLEKVNGVIMPEQEQRLQGDLTRLTYRIPENHSAEEVFGYFMRQLESQGADIMFQCQGRACGSSNHWANDVFGYFRLYGPDEGQYYAALSWQGNHVALYSITRGNRRVFTRLEIVQGSSGPETDSLPATGMMVLTDEESIKQLVQLLKKVPQAVWLVSFNFDSGSRSHQLSASESTLQEMKQRLIDMGVEPELIRLYPLGSFSPTESLTSDSGIFVYTDTYQGQGKQ